MGFVYWFTAPLAKCSPSNDLQLLKIIIHYDNPDIIEVTVKQFLGHLWYLSDKLFGLCLFSHNVFVGTKRVRVTYLQKFETYDQQST